MYLTYDEYADMGGTMEESLFSRREYAVRMLVDQHTMRRVSRMAVVPEAVKMLMFELIEQEQRDALADAVPQIVSFNTDGYSESYAKPITADERNSQKMTLIRKYLMYERDDNGVALLYRGVSQCS